MMEIFKPFNTPRRRLIREVQYLDRVAPTPDAIAQRLRTAGVTGRQGSPIFCPLAQYLSARVGVGVFVGLRNTWVNLDKLPIELPWPLVEFVNMFDHGNYPDLDGPARAHLRR